MNGRTLAALTGFLVLGLSPSFIDWQDDPARRPEIVAYYAVGLTLLYIGLLER